VLSGRPADAPPACGARSQEELINVGQKNSALQALHDVITSKVRAAARQPGAAKNRG
jgi:hypothetical protein